MWNLKLTSYPVCSKFLLKLRKLSLYSVCRIYIKVKYPVIIWNRFFHWTWSSLILKDKLTSNSHGPSCLHLYSVLMTIMHHYAQLFKWELRIVTQVSSRSPWLHGKNFTKWAISPVSNLSIKIRKVLFLKGCVNSCFFFLSESPEYIFITIMWLALKWRRLFRWLENLEGYKAYNLWS